MASFLVIDGDPLIYKFGLTSHSEIKWDETTTSVDDDLPKAEKGVAEYIEWLLEFLDAEDYILTFTDSEGNFRKKLLPTYKHNRKGLTKPDIWYQLDDSVKSNHPHLLIEGLEADDVCGILGTGGRQAFIDFGLQAPDEELDIVVVSVDKDFRTLPITLFNPDKDEFEQHIDPKEGFHMFMTQTLMGDSTDGYSGCPRVGKVGAAKLLKGMTEPWEMWATVVDAYESKGLTEEDAILQARMARILQYGEFDFETNSPILWAPDNF